MNKQATKKIVATLTSLATVAMMTAGAFIPIAAHAALSTDLTHCWKLDETSGTRMDSVGTSHLTDNGGVGSAPGKINNAANFSSNTQYLSTSDTLFPSSTQTTTFGVWAYIDPQNAGYAELITGSHFSLYYGGGQINLEVIYSYPTSTVQFTGLTGGLGWYYLVGGFDSAQQKSFLSINGGAVTYSADASGAGTGAGGTYFRDTATSGGLLDEVGAWSRLLTATEISQLYNSGNGLACPFPAATPTPTPFVPPFCTTYVTSWGSAGAGNGQFTTPTDIDVNDAANRVFVTDFGNNRIQVFDTSGVYQTQWSTAPAKPGGLAVDASGNVIVSMYDTVAGTTSLVKYSPTGTPITTLFSGPYATYSAFSSVAVDPVDGEIFTVQATTNGNIYKFPATGGTPTSIATFGSPYNVPSSISVAPNGKVFVSGIFFLDGTAVVKMYNNDGSSPVVMDTTSDPTFRTTFALVANSAYVNVLASNGTAPPVRVFDVNGVYLGGGWGTTGSLPGQLSSPRGAAYANGFYYITEGIARVSKFGCPLPSPSVSPSPSGSPSPTGDYKDILTFNLQTLGQGAAKFDAIPGSQLKVYDTNDAAFKAAYGTTFSSWNSKLDQIYNGSVLPISYCTTDGDGACTALKSAAGDYLVVGQFKDTQNTKTVYVSKKELAGEFNADKENFADLKVIKNFKQNAPVTYGPGGQVVVVDGLPVASSSGFGSYLALAAAAIAVGLGVGLYARRQAK